MSTRILFLAANVQPFLASGIAALLQEYDVSVLLLCNRDNPDVSILPPAHPRLKVLWYHRRPDAAFTAELMQFRPGLVYCAGWMHQQYLGWCRSLQRQGAVTICAMDTQWKGTFRQHLLSLAAPLLFRSVFTHAWVPGIRQEQYARKLGFRSSRILPLLCTADTALWSSIYSRFQTQDSIRVKEFLYIGRLEPHKLRNLLLAFRQLSSEERCGWRLRIIGSGTMSGDPLLQHEAICVSGFLPQQQLTATISAAAGCLCSSDEPWGTVIQEMAAAGLPLVVSSQCGAQPHFVTDGENGFVCDGNDAASIRSALLKMIACDAATMAAMAELSHQRGTGSHSGNWAAVLMGLTGK